MEVWFGKKNLQIPDVKKSLGIKGLMFCSKEKANPLLLNSAKPIHSFFVFFNFLVLWLNSEDKVVEWKIVKPWSLHEKSKKKFSKILEIPLNQRYKEVIRQITSSSI